MAQSVTSAPKQVQSPSGTLTPSAPSTPPPVLEAGLKTKLADFASRALVPKTIACYGFDKPRGELQKKLIAEKATLKSYIFTMNTLNADVGIDVYTAMDVLKFVHENRVQLEALPIDQRVDLYCKDYIPLPPKGSLKGKWLHFLMENLSSIDIIGKLTELAQEARKAPAPSLPPTPSRLEYVRGSEPRLEEVLQSFINKNSKGRMPNATLKSDLLAGLRASPPSTPSSLDRVLTTALFRQTSKLGLQFCAQQKVPVAFSWQAYDEQSSPTGWLTQPAPQTRRSITAFVPITGSEMRLVSSEPSIQPVIFRVPNAGFPSQPAGLVRGPKLP